MPRGCAFLLRVERSAPMTCLKRSERCLFLERGKCAAAIRGQGVPPCISSRGGGVGWMFLLRVKRVSLLMTSWMLLVCKLEVCGHCAKAGSVAPLHPHEGRRGSFAARLGVFLKVERSVPMKRLGRAGCRLFAESEVRDRCSRAGSVAPLHPLRGGEVLLLRGWEFS